MVNPRYQSHVVGEGPIVFDLWLDYLCPYSAKLFFKLFDEVIPSLKPETLKNIRFVFNHQIQPWHPHGVVLHEVAIAASLLAPDKFWAFSRTLFEHQADFFDEEVVNKTRTELIVILVDLARQTGITDTIKLGQAVSVTLKMGDSAKNRGNQVTHDIKTFVKLGRQNGIHHSPTVCCNGIKRPEIGSSWTKEQWSAEIQKACDVSQPICNF